MNRSFLTIPCFLLMLTTTGCVARLGDFTVISTKNVDLGSQYVKADNISCEGVDKVFVVLIPFGEPNIENAVDKCLNSSGGDLLTNAVLQSEYYGIIIVGQTGFKVRGDVWKRASVSDLQDPSRPIYRLVSSPTGLQLVSERHPEERHPVFEPDNAASYAIKPAQR